MSTQRPECTANVYNIYKYLQQLHNIFTAKHLSKSDQAVVYLYNAVSLGHKKELSIETHYKIDEYHNNYAE